MQDFGSGFSNRDGDDDDLSDWESFKLMAQRGLGHPVDEPVPRKSKWGLSSLSSFCAFVVWNIFLRSLIARQSVVFAAVMDEAAEERLQIPLRKVVLWSRLSSLDESPFSWLEA